jgi:hypothetical protein
MVLQSTLSIIFNFFDIKEGKSPKKRKEINLVVVIPMRSAA